MRLPGLSPVNWSRSRHGHPPSLGEGHVDGSDHGRADATGEQERIERARLYGDVDVDAASALPSRTRRALSVAKACGTPSGPVLAVAGRIASQRADLAADLDRVVKPAIGIARGLVALPLVMVPLLAMVLDLDLVAFWTTDPLGRVVAMIVVGMVGVAALWLHLLVRSAIRPTASLASTTTSGRRGVVIAVAGAVLAWVLVAWWAGVAVGGVLWQRRGRAGAMQVGAGVDEAADLTAIGVAAGFDLPAALRLAADELPDVELASQVRALALRLSLWPPSAGRADHRRVARPPSGSLDPGEGVDTSMPGFRGLDRIEPLTQLVTDLIITGHAAAAPLHRLATRLRRRDADRVRVSVARLPGRLTFPTALLLVPATVLAIGTPIAIRGLTAIGGT